MIRDSGYFNNVCAEIEKKNQRNEISQRQRQSTRRIHYNRPQSLFTKEPKNNQQIANIFICKLAVTKLQESINHLAFFGVLRDSVFVCVCDGLSVRERETEADEDRDRNAWRRDNATEATTELSLYYIFVSRWLARYQKWLFFPRFYSFALIFFAETFRLCRVTHLHFVNARLVQRLELFVTSVGQFEYFLVAFAFAFAFIHRWIVRSYLWFKRWSYLIHFTWLCHFWHFFFFFDLIA